MLAPLPAARGAADRPVPPSEIEVRAGLPCLQAGDLTAPPKSVCFPESQEGALTDWLVGVFQGPGSLNL